MPSERRAGRDVDPGVARDAHRRSLCADPWTDARASWCPSGHRRRCRTSRQRLPGCPNRSSGSSRRAAALPALRMLGRGLQHRHPLDLAVVLLVGQAGRRARRQDKEHGEAGGGRRDAPDQRSSAPAASALHGDVAGQWASCIGAACPLRGVGVVGVLRVDSGRACRPARAVDRLGFAAVPTVVVEPAACDVRCGRRRRCGGRRREPLGRRTGGIRSVGDSVGIRPMRRFFGGKGVVEKDTASSSGEIDVHPGSTRLVNAFVRVPTVGPRHVRRFGSQYGSAGAFSTRASLCQSSFGAAMRRPLCWSRPPAGIA